MSDLFTKQLAKHRPKLSTSNILDPYSSELAYSQSMDSLAVLKAYSSGAMSRSAAMRLLGLDWYGDLLVMLNAQGMAKPSASEADRVAMDAALAKVFDKLPRLPGEHR